MDSGLRLGGEADELTLIIRSAHKTEQDSFVREPPCYFLSLHLNLCRSGALHESRTTIQGSNVVIRLARFVDHPMQCGGSAPADFIVAVVHAGELDGQQVAYGGIVVSDEADVLRYAQPQALNASRASQAAIVETPAASTLPSFCKSALSSCPAPSCLEKSSLRRSKSAPRRSPARSGWARRCTGTGRTGLVEHGRQVGDPAVSLFD